MRRECNGRVNLWGRQRWSRSITLGVAVTAGVLVAGPVVGPARAAPHTAPASAFTAHDDAYLTTAGRTVHGQASVLATDKGASTLISHTEPAHGSLTMQPDGTFRYVPKAGYTGVDTLTYAASDAVKVSRTHLPPPATIGGVKITGGAYGSSLYPVPGSKDE